MTALLRVEGISKSYPGVRALRDVSFAVERGTIHAVMGENGAGKSTLMQIIAGAQRPDAGGRLVFEGEPLEVGGTAEAAAKGISIVFQELMLVPNLSVAENIFLGAEQRAGGVFVARDAMKREAEAVLARLGVAIPAGRRLGELTIAQQQLVEICKALVHRPKLLILDEPTSSLGEADTAVLFRIVHELRGQGVTILYISHRMPEVFRHCDAVTVLRDGGHVATLPLSETSEEAVVRMMVGRDLAAMQRPASRESRGPVRLAVRGLGDGARYHDVSFELRAGEIVGLAGLIGAGRSEMALGLFGAPSALRGTVEVEGRPVRIRRPRDAMALGIGLVPEDRKDQGLVLGMGVGRNMSLAALELGRVSRAGFISGTRENGLVKRYSERFRVRTPSAAQAVGLLSGGNQQKVVLAKWLAPEPRVLIVDEPTRGVDVGTKAEIYAAMRELAAGGLAMLVISSDLPEILAVSDRVLVMRAGRIAGEIPGPEATEEGIMALAALEARPGGVLAA